MREKREKIVQSFTIQEDNTEDGSLEFDWIPLRENNDSVVAIGDDSLSDHPSLCPVQIRMRAEGSFGVMNYRHSISCATVRYHVNRRYHIRLTLNKEAKTYSVWIAPPGRRPVQVGRDHMFLMDAPECTGFRKIFLIMDRQDDCKLENWKTGPARDDCFPSGKCGSGRNPAMFQVGPARKFKTLQEVEDLLYPGDTVLVDGDCTYYGGLVFPHHGTEDASITVKGVEVNGRRPLIDGGRGDLFAVELSGHNFVFEGFEVIGGTKAAICHHANNIVIRDCVIHDSPMGILSDQDIGMGNILVEYCEVYHCGKDMYSHQLYMATDEIRFPGSVSRIRFCYIHDASGGNNIKSRAERNEIYYNWLENPFYHNLELIGPDPDYNPAGEDLAREDSDVAGNVLISSGWYQARLGGDGTGQSKGRYRFANNTFLCNYPVDKAAEFSHFRIMFGIESIEMHNNLFYDLNNGRATPIYYEDRAEWVAGRRVIGESSNWVEKGCDVKDMEDWTGTIAGTDPGFLKERDYDFRLKADSPLVGKGTFRTESPEGYAFPNPLPVPLYVPPARALLRPGTAGKREIGNGGLNIGAY